MSMSSDRYITPQEVRQELNILEQIESIIDSEDEFLQAILHNQKITGMLVLQMMEGGGADGSRPTGIDFDNLPPGFIGLSMSDLNTGERGKAVFSVEGSNIYTDIEAAQDISQEDVVNVIDDGNQVVRLTEVNEGHLTFGKISFSGVSSKGYQMSETENNVTISPGETKTVLTVNVNNPSFWWETGTKDQTYSLYQYEVDGENMLDVPMSQPLGLYNDTYRFPRPIIFDSQIKIKIFRDPAAPGDEDYFSRTTTTRS
jgi:hypothetical protein